MKWHHHRRIGNEIIWRRRSAGNDVSQLAGEYGVKSNRAANNEGENGEDRRRRSGG
jgi:hypothetical protein